MKRILFLALMVCLSAMTVSAQGKTDFSGNWELDTLNSRMDERMRVEAMTMKVNQTEKAITVGTFTKRSMPTTDGDGVQKRVEGVMAQTLTYSLVPGMAVEGKTLSSDNPNMETNTLKAALESDGRLKLHSTRSFETEAGKMEIKVDEVWELADGGKTLKVTRTTESPRGINSFDLVFTKKDASEIVETNTNTSSTPKNINGGVVNNKAVSLVKPAYPDAAKAVRASGAVNVQVTIDEEGNVISASAVSGHPLLRAASEEAARASKFSPTLLSGQPVKVTGIIVYNFVP